MSEIKTKFAATNKMKQCTDSESSRYALGGVHVMQSADDNQVYLTACDGRILAVNRVAGHTDKTRIAPNAVLPTKLKGGNVELNGKWMNDQGKYCDDMPMGRYLCAADVFDPIGAASHLLIHVDADLLRNVLEAMTDRSAGASQVTLIVDTAEVDIDENTQYRSVSRAIQIAGQSCRFGVIMPMPGDTGTPSAFAEHVRDYRQAFEKRGKVENDEA